LRLGPIGAVLLLAARAAAQDVAPPAAPAAFVRAAAVQRGCEILLEMQEGEGRREWPYEGVYRVAEKGSEEPVIPIGYRVGGTAIACLALIAAPGYADEPQAARREAVERGVGFVLEALELPLMEPERRGDYDVRGWGFIYALQLLAELERRALVPEVHAKAVDKAIPRLVEALEDTEISSAGGWNYSGAPAPAPFMTAPALQALFMAAAGGHKVKAKVVTRALDSLERGRAPSGSIAYTTPRKALDEEDEAKNDSMMDKLPGSIGRMVASEAALVLGGLGDQQQLAAAVEAFFEHWEQLESRRQQPGTHMPPYGVAPYYFMYAHAEAALAIELLEDPALRDRQRARLEELLARVQEPGGGWNDRVFPRSRAVCTALGVLALLARDEAAPGRRKAGGKR